jgi:hypothetical protein
MAGLAGLTRMAGSQELLALASELWPARHSNLQPWVDRLQAACRAVRDGFVSGAPGCAAALDQALAQFIRTVEAGVGEPPRPQEPLRPLELSWPHRVNTAAVRLPRLVGGEGGVDHNKAAGWVRDVVGGLALFPAALATRLQCGRTTTTDTAHVPAGTSGRCSTCWPASTARRLRRWGQPHPAQVGAA